MLFFPVLVHILPRYSVILVLVHIVNCDILEIAHFIVALDSALRGRVILSHVP